MDHLHEVVEQNAPAHLIPHFLTFLSDRQKGLLEVVQYSFPNSPHAYCIRHLYENFHKRFKNPLLKQLLWDAARSVTIEIRMLSKKCTKSHLNVFLGCSSILCLNIGLKATSTVLNRYGHFTSNIAESINSWLLEAREMQILAMLEQIRHQLMEWFVQRRRIDQHMEGLLVSSAANIIQK